ncbi:hypothetical protein AGR8A_Cc40352 [Agrobacterium fabrum str. J-07]|nr:hypothetical protein AGR8A_Cc40352 [Agrobacterium fabrum str. J-07]
MPADILAICLFSGRQALARQCLHACFANGGSNSAGVWGGSAFISTIEKPVEAKNVGVAAFLQHKQKTRPLGALFAGEPIKTLLDLGFLEFNVLAYNRVILRLRHLVRERTAVLGGDVEGTGVGCRQQLDLDCCSFRHGRPAFKQMRSRRRFSPRLNLARNYVSRPKSQACFARKTKRNP